MCPTSKQNQHISISDHTGTGLGTGICTLGQRPSPASGGEIQLPEVIESGGRTCAASKHVHAALVWIINGTVGISLADGVDTVLHRLVGPQQGPRGCLTSEVLQPHGHHPLAAVKPPGADTGAVVEVTVGRDQAEDVFQNLIRKFVNAFTIIVITGVV